MSLIAARGSEQVVEVRNTWEQWAATMPEIPDDTKIYNVYGEVDLPKATNLGSTS